MISRRKLLSSVSALGAASAFSLSAAFAAESDSRAASLGGEAIDLEDGWQFRLDPGAASSAAGATTFNTDWQTVSVPHTWQSLSGSPDYVGVAWYRREIIALEAWRHRFVRVEFEAVFHTASVFLNGKVIGQHVGKGYTAFTCDLSPALRYGQPNDLSVRVDNSFSKTMLPRMQSFDWANDGGITRPVHLRVSAPVFIERLEIDAVPDLERNTAHVSLAAVVRNTQPAARSARLSAELREETSGSRQMRIARQTDLPPRSVTKIVLDPIQMDSPRLWHFDAPHLYWAEATVEADGQLDTCVDHFGIRKFETRGSSFYLNGERVSLFGVERMAGSHPEYGMAEPTAWIDANHRDLKDLNCIFTRVHWAQDQRVLDFCDRHGILMQEEVPAWGPATFDNLSPELKSQLDSNGVEQLREMISRDRNHPCIVSWGLCNEVNGQNPASRAFARKLADEARTLDPSRLLTYASNSLQEHPEADMAGDLDFISVNEYYGSWSPGGPVELRSCLDRTRKAFPNKPIVISEYGWCECQPTMPPGDEHRIRIIRDHTAVFREFPEVAGAIYFDYNDYRTIAGDKGAGALRQRVHGIVDLYAGRKPSFDALRREASPIQSLTIRATGDEFTLHIVTRTALPAYTLRGYSVRWLFYGYDDLPVDGSVQPLAPVMPGQDMQIRATTSMNGLRRVVADIFRPTGFSVSTAEMRLGAAD
ncbi:MAG TPA: glycoside hydrolase family 2 TIM barrel-domain containing protein [Acidobacteriaceae bacterium]|jgi:beta-glucuronidase|nr:glycoside hydrolase family 2 TIM barrel-domain containing protein [Acidobacteriaceae bacterium]